MGNGWGGARPGAGAKPKHKNGGALPKIQVSDTKGVARETIPAEPKQTTTLNLNSIEQIIELSEKYARQKSRPESLNPFKLPAFPPGATPKDNKLTMAMDESITWGSQQWAGAVLDGVTAEGLSFLGYPFLAELAQRPEYRVISETIADDATRKWIDFDVTGEESENKRKAEQDPEGEAERMADPDEKKKRVKAAGKTDKVKELKDDQERLDVRDRFYAAARDDGFFGRSHIYIDLGVDLDGDKAELKTPIGDGRNDVSGSKIAKGSLRSLKVVEPIWTYPTSYNAQNPLKPDWYNPQVWFTMGNELHASRLLTFVGHPVPDILKPAYAFGGLALSQMAKPYVDIWLKTRESVAALIHSFSVMVLETDLQTLLQPGQAGNLIARALLFNATRDNQGLMIINKMTEAFQNVSASLAGLHELQAQAQEHICSVVRIPLVKFTGISPAGLNPTAEGEITIYDDTILAYQNRFFRRPLTKVINFEQLSLWGEIDPEITFEFDPLRVLTEKEKGEQQKADAERHQIYIDAGVVAPAEVRKVIVNDPDLPYTELDPDDVPDLKEEEEMGLEPEGGRPNPIEGGPGGKKGEGGGQDRAILPFQEGVDPRLAGDAGWNEGDHPRAPDGKFGSGGQHFRAPQLGLKHSPANFSFSDWLRSLRPKPKSSGDPQSPEGIVVFGMGGEHPKAIGGVPFEAWQPPEDWADVDGQADVGEPEIPEVPKGMSLSSGLLIREPDGRVWMMRPKGGYAGYEQTFPKGGAEMGLSLQANAIKEAFEETGIKARVLSFAGDFEGDTTVTRFYVAEREAGDPTKFGEETEGVVLAPPGKLKEFLNRERDRKIAGAIVGDEANFEESKHPRDKEGKFVTTAGGGGAPVSHDPISKNPAFPMEGLKKLGGTQMGSNPGGIYETPSGGQYYIKETKSKAHTKNELLAAKLFALTGSPTLQYQPMADEMHVATKMENLEKNNVSQLSPEEKKQAQADFVAHAWLANYDAAGTGGDNIGVIGGKVTPLDFGGALEYRAQGKPKENFGDKVTELQTMLDPDVSPDAAKLYGGMTGEEAKASAQRVVNIPNKDIKEAVESFLGKGNAKAEYLAQKMIDRKNDIAKVFNVEFESKHERGPGGKFAKMVGENIDEVANGTAELVENFGVGVSGETGASIYKTTDGYVVVTSEDGDPGDAFFAHTLTEAKAKANEAVIEMAGKEEPEPEAKPVPAPEPMTFKSKKDHVAHLLSKGTTTAEILKATGWPSVSVPQQAKAAGMKLEKYKEGGVTKYKGIPMTDAEKAEAKATSKSAKATVTPAEKKLDEFVKKVTVEQKKIQQSPATSAELEKAKKSVPLKVQYVPGAPVDSPQAQKLVDEFNKKYAGKEMKTQDQLEQKVADFKTMQAAMIPLVSEAQQQKMHAQAEAAAKAAEEAKKQKEKEAAAAKEAAEKNKAVMEELGLSETEAFGFGALVKMMGGKQADVINTFKSYEEKAKTYGYPITGFQCALIRNYTGSGYRAINEALRSGSWTAAQHVYVKMMNNALQKMPTFTGVTKRGTTLPSSEQQRYVVGNVTEERAFTSTSPSSPWSGNTQFTIKAVGKRGAYVKKLSGSPSEDEVVFSAHTFFHVDKVEGSPGGSMHVYLTEIEGAE